MLGEIQYYFQNFQMLGEIQHITCRKQKKKKLIIEPLINFFSCCIFSIQEKKIIERKKSGQNTCGLSI